MSRRIRVAACLLLSSAACNTKPTEEETKETGDQQVSIEEAPTAVAPSSGPRPGESAIREDADFARWSAGAKATPPDAIAAYNAGQYLYERKRYEEALAMWTIAKVAQPDDFDAAKKVVQALNALVRHDEAVAAMSDVRRIFSSSADVAVKKQEDVVIDHLVVRGRSVIVYEALVPSDPELHYHWTARVLDASGKQVDFTVQLESSEFGRETGRPFLTGVKRRGGHASFESYNSLPPYGQWREVAIQRITGELAR